MGIILIIVGGLLGYMTPGICINIFHWYPAAWTNLTYLPLFIGIYMVLAHTILLGWHTRQNRYKNIITTSIMRFQGKQTIRNMLVVTVLLAGAYFASFYTPVLATSSLLKNNFM